MKVALLQCSASQHKADNLAQALDMSREAIAHGAEFILLPEVFNFRGDGRDPAMMAGVTEKIPGPSTEAFSTLAKKHKAAFLLGSILEKAGKTRAYNTSVFIDPHGQIRAKYRKIHLFDACIGGKIVKEKDVFLAGRRSVTTVLGEFRMGLSICYDLRFPDLYQKYARKGVEILTVPSCFTKKTGEAHWEILLRARAVENLSYILAPNQIGVDARGMQAYGHSMIVSPWGEIIARGSGEAQEIIYGEISLDVVKKARETLPGIIK